MDRTPERQLKTAKALILRDKVILLIVIEWDLMEKISNDLVIKKAILNILSEYVPF